MRYLEAAGVPFPQLTAYLWRHQRAPCKTVGYAYVGSNPTPATR
jgi:hypothetical protein